MKKIPIEAIREKLRPAQKDAVGLLEEAGFMAFTDARLEDVRELSTGKRRRTYRNQGRYGLVLALKSAADLDKAEEQPAPEAPVQEKPVPEENAAE